MKCLFYSYAQVTDLVHGTHEFPLRSNSREWEVEQLEHNLSAVELVPLLTDEVMQHIESALDNKPKHPAY